MIVILSAAYPNGKAYERADVLNVWYEMLKGYKGAAVINKLTEHIKRSPYPPAIADLIPDEVVTSSEDAWEEVSRMIASYGYYRQADCLQAMTEPQRRAVKAIGYGRLCQSPVNSLRSEFLSLYREDSAVITV